MKKITTVILLVFSALAHSAPPILVDQETGKYLDNLSANQHDQNSVNSPFGQHGNWHLQDSVNKRNNPIARHGDQYLQDSINKRNTPARYNAVIVKLGNPLVGQGRLYLQDSTNKRNNPSGKYYAPVKLDNTVSNVTNPHRTVVTVPLYSW
ncbi:MAG: hypothetical protein V3S58_02875 [Nitrosomonadaceae bacterium]